MVTVYGWASTGGDDSFWSEGGILLGVGARFIALHERGGGCSLFLGECLVPWILLIPDDLVLMAEGGAELVSNLQTLSTHTSVR